MLRVRKGDLKLEYTGCAERRAEVCERAIEGSKVQTVEKEVWKWGVRKISRGQINPVFKITEAREA